MPISSALGSSALLPSGLGFRNLIINGNMRIAQRGTAAVSTTDGFAVDRWKIGIGTTGAWTAQQVATSTAAVLGGFDYAYKFTKTTGNTPAAGEYNYLVQYIEGNNIAGLSWGTSAAKPVVLSFWVYSGATGTFGGTLRNSGGPFWAYGFTYTINVANTWEYKVVYINGPTTGTWSTDNSAGISLFFDLGSGANARVTGGSWQSGTNAIGASGTSQYPTNTSGGYLYITGVQLEQNYQPTPFEQRPIGVELALCQRYYFRMATTSASDYAAYGAGTVVASGYATMFFKMPTTMRAVPTSLGSSAVGTFYVETATGAGNPTAITIYRASQDNFTVNLTKASTVAGYGCALLQNGTNPSYLEASAEL